MLNYASFLPAEGHCATSGDISAHLHYQGIPAQEFHDFGNRSTLSHKTGTIDCMTFVAEIATGKLPDLIKQVQAGHEVLLMQGDMPVAKLVPALERSTSPNAPVRIRSFSGHRVLTPLISQADLADEMFRR
jgi:antitoxin (DNA-binding transcriptional repressor) of toxin-antitoxin stability system